MSAVAQALASGNARAAAPGSTPGGRGTPNPMPMNSQAANTAVSRVQSVIASKGMDDLVLLEEITEDTVANAISSRLRNEQQMYTYIGPVLVAINPFKLLSAPGRNGSLYDESMIDAYRGRTRIDLPPHIFAVAEDAYSTMLRTRCPQSVIVSGESGSGKTESCRQLLAYIARVSGDYVSKRAAKAPPPPKVVPGRGGKASPMKPRPEPVAMTATAMQAISSANRIKERLLTSNLVLEAFGNAKTTRNDNSSRFGKLMEVFFRASGVATGGAVRVYLLERRRIVAQNDGERSFHVLHQLTSGATPDMRSGLFIKSPQDYRYLSFESRTIAGVNDATNFKALTDCMAVLGMNQAELKETVWKAMAVVLNLGNIDFTSEVEADKNRAQKRKDAEQRKAMGLDDEEEDEVEEDIPNNSPGQITSGNSNSAVGVLNPHVARFAETSESEAAVNAVCKLLGVSEAVLLQSLTTRSITVRGETAHAQNTTVEARNARDSLARAIYARIFDYVVDRINASINVMAGSESSNQAKAVNNLKPTESKSPVKETGTPKAPENSPEAGNASANGLDPIKIPSGTGTPNSTSSAATGKSNTPNVEVQAATPQATGSNSPAETEEELKQLKLAVLDLYGFEVLGTNGFDQLNINFVNEKLQQLFIMATLQAEQDEYNAEGIQWEPIPYFNNTIVLELIEGKPGVYSLLDDLGQVGGRNDDIVDKSAFRSDSKSGGDKALQQLNTKLSKHEHYISKKVNDGTFGIRHFAGDVMYSSEGLVAANTDRLGIDLVQLMTRSKGLPLMAKLFQDDRSAEEKKRKPPTASQSFRQSVQDLIQTLSITQCHYVRCILSNNQKKPVTIDPEVVQHQVRYLGLVENTRVKRAGWAYRETYENFLNRFRVLSKTTWPPREDNDFDQVQQLMKNLRVTEKQRDAVMGVGQTPGMMQGGAVPGRPGAMGMVAGRPGGGPMGMVPGRPGGMGPPPAAMPMRGQPNKGGVQTDSTHQFLMQLSATRTLPGDFASGYTLQEGVDYLFGNTKLFIRHPKHFFALEYMRTVGLGIFVSRVAALWRAHAGKREYKRMLAAWKKMIVICRGFVYYKRYQRMKTEVVKIQALVRGHLVRRSPVVEDLRECLGLISFHGKTRRTKSLRWERPQGANGNDWLKILDVNSGYPSPSAQKLSSKLANLPKPVALNQNTLLYSDRCVKIRQSYKMVRRALVLTNTTLFSLKDEGGNGWSNATIKRIIPVTNISKISLSPYRDSYMTIHVEDMAVDGKMPKKSNAYAFMCILESKISFAKLLVQAYKTLFQLGHPTVSGTEALNVEVAPEWTYKAFAKDSLTNIRKVSIREVLEKDAEAVFGQRIKSPNEQALEALPGGLGGGVFTPPQAPEGGSPGGGTGGAQRTIATSVEILEKYKPFHVLQPDNVTMLVYTLSPQKATLGELLSAKEKEILKKKGFRAVLKL